MSVRKGIGIVMAAAGLAGLLPFSAFGAGAPPIVESQPLGSQSGASGQRGSIEDRLARLEAQAESQVLLEMLARLESLQVEVQELRGSVEIQGHRVEGMEQRQRELYLDIDRRMRQLETGNRPGAGGSTAPPASEPGASAPAAGAAAMAAVAVAPSAPADRPAGAGNASADPQSERDAYNRAFDLIKAGRYDESISAFRSFLSRYPDSEYSANAQYWVGEAHYVSRRFDLAAEEFGKVLQFYPDSGKSSDAMLKLGFSQYELQQWERASETLARVVEQYPRSTARQLAEGRLQRMRMEGR